MRFFHQTTSAVPFIEAAQIVFYLLPGSRYGMCHHGVPILERFGSGIIFKHEPDAIEYLY